MIELLLVAILITLLAPYVRQWYLTRERKKELVIREAQRRSRQ